MKSSKYHAKPTFIHRETGALISEEMYSQLKKEKPNSVIRFDSKHESRVYEIIKKVYPDYEIDVHFNILVRPASTQFPALRWNADFHIKTNYYKDELIIEAKGVMTPEFKYKMMMLESFYPQYFNRVWVVYDKPETRKGGYLHHPQYNIAIADLERYLKRWRNVNERPET